MQEKDNMVQLLENAKQIADHYYRDSIKQGEKFNIFYIQGTASDEVRVCRFIKELLDPKGSHGQGTFFLQRFMKIVLQEKDCFSDDDYKNALVDRELRISDARRIDIVIRIRNRIFPLEVKIYADDQEDQCSDYYNYATSKDPKAKVYYLTLDGHEPSDMSKGTLKPGQFECISFAENILAWLDDCINADELAQVHSVKEILIQFRHVISDLTGRQEGKGLNEIKKIISEKPENVMAAIEISKALMNVKAEKMQEIFACIKTQMKDLGFPESLDNYIKESEQYYRSRKETKPKIRYIIPVSDKGLEGKIALCYEITERLYVGLQWADGEKVEEVPQYVRERLIPPNMRIQTDDSHFFWWCYLHENNSANFRLENDEYLDLYDQQGFEDYIKELYLAIDKISKLL